MSTSLKCLPVKDDLDFEIFSGVPSATIFPPFSPPSGPKSIIQSEFLITSKLCSITMTVLPLSTKRCRTSSNLSTSAKWRPVVGSSRI